jgi:hypothetical protein
MNNVIRNCILLFVAFIALSLNSGCSTCENCSNNLSPYIGNYFPYQNGEIVEFINSDSLVVRDSVVITYDSPDGKYGCRGSKEPSYECSGSYVLSIGDFTFGLRQMPNIYNNDLYRTLQVSMEDYYAIKHYSIVDTLDYTFKGSTLKAIYYKCDETDFSLKDYYDLYVSFENKLLEYSTKEGQLIERWYSRY